MKVSFWGVRGSIPTPLPPEALKRMIAAVLMRAQPADLASPETREAFLGRLPPCIFGTVGGQHHLILFTHFHWDRLQGLPFFSPSGYQRGNRLIFCGPREDLPEILEGQRRPPCFPVGMEAMGAEKRFVRLARPGERICGLEAYWKEMKHPGGCLAYKIERYDWGHTSYSMAVDSAAEWNIRTLALFHRDPSYNDRKIHGILNSAQWHRARLHKRSFEVILAMEGRELEL